MPEHQVQADVAAPLLIRVKPYHRTKRLALRAYLPFQRQPAANPVHPPMKRLPPPTPQTNTGSLPPD